MDYSGFLLSPETHFKKLTLFVRAILDSWQIWVKDTEISHVLPAPRIHSPSHYQNPPPEWLICHSWMYTDTSFPKVHSLHCCFTFYYFGQIYEDTDPLLRYHIEYSTVLRIFRDHLFIPPFSRTRAITGLFNCLHSFAFSRMSWLVTYGMYPFLVGFCYLVIHT